MYRFYAVEWNPNGTNDLVVVNQYNEVVDYIQEALFGVRVSYGRTLRVCAGELVYTIYKGSYRPEIHGIVKRVSKADLVRKLCVSPIDPNGDAPRRQLKKYLQRSEA